MVIGVALIGVITVALVDAYIAVIITTKEIMRASPGHPPPGPVRLPRTLASEGHYRSCRGRSRSSDSSAIGALLIGGAPPNFRSRGTSRPAETNSGTGELINSAVLRRI